MPLEQHVAELQAAYDRIDELTGALRQAQTYLLEGYGDAHVAVDTADHIGDVLEERVAA